MVLLGQREGALAAAVGGGGGGLLGFGAGGGHALAYAPQGSNTGIMGGPT